MKKNYVTIKNYCVILFMTFAFGTSIFAQEICDNGIDDDGDNLIDLMDDDCDICDVPNHMKLIDVELARTHTDAALNFTIPAGADIAFMRVTGGSGSDSSGALNENHNHANITIDLVNDMYSGTFQEVYGNRSQDSDNNSWANIALGTGGHPAVVTRAGSTLTLPSTFPLSSAVAAVEFYDNDEDADPCKTIQIFKEAVSYNSNLTPTVLNLPDEGFVSIYSGGGYSSSGTNNQNENHAYRYRVLDITNSTQYQAYMTNSGNTLTASNSTISETSVTYGATVTAPSNNRDARNSMALIYEEVQPDINAVKQSLYIGTETSTDNGSTVQTFTAPANATYAILSIDGATRTGGGNWQEHKMGYSVYIDFVNETTTGSYSFVTNTNTNPGGNFDQWTDEAFGTTHSNLEIDVTGSTLTLGNVIGTSQNTTYKVDYFYQGDASCAPIASVCPDCTDSTTWDGLAWSNGVPTLADDTAIINGDYNTTTHGSFSCCELTVNAGFELEVTDGNYVEVENNTDVAGELIVSTKGNFVQNSETSTFTLSGAGTSSVNKSSSTHFTRFDYTYWGSPVIGATLETVFVDAGIRYFFNAANFEDLLIETNNTNQFIAGNDDIDDNGDDWSIASGVMNVGQGYAMTYDPAATYPTTHDVTFSGAFNNGPTSTAALTNNSGGAYNDWNLISNPFPCAISASDFFTTNAGVVAPALHLWSHATPFDPNAPGSRGSHFAASDYAIITGSGVNTAGGDGVIPTSYVPSGQAFMVEATSAASVTFNNAMRETGNHTQFFRPNNTENKLWINLTSDNGVFNQFAISYLNGATDGYDGAFYDVERNMSTQNPGVIYTFIESQGDSKFAIQAKDVNTINDTEVIPFGLKSEINEETLFTIAIQQFEGDFLTNNDIYLKDNLLNITHNLKVSNYDFESVAGQHDDRFEIVFRNNVLSNNDFVSEDQLNITKDLSSFNFSMKNGSKIESIEVYDLLGRLLLDINGNNQREISINTSKLNDKIFIARVHLNNNQSISKKIINN